MQPDLHIIILAAGKGTRMRSNLPKVLHRLGGKPLLEHVIRTATAINPKQIHVVYGDGGKQVIEALPHINVNWVEQKQQLGTGHAVMQVLPLLPKDSQILILYGDVPLISEQALRDLVLNTPANGLSLMTAELDNPTGFGRIMRDPLGNIKAIIEHKDATSGQKEIKEINTGIMCTSFAILQNYLPKLNQHNAQGEYYLTDIIAMAVTDKLPITGIVAVTEEEVLGINDHVQLAKLERYYQKQLANDLMHQGLTLLDPARFDLRGELQIGTDVTFDVNVIIEGQVSIGANTTVANNNFLKNVTIGENVEIRPNCVIEDAIIEDNCIIGPFARIRPKSLIKAGAHVGNFVETKNTVLGKNSKANHLTYLGDATIGQNVNVGAGTITCNYDGVNKHQTIIEDGAFIGSDVTLVAPIRIGKNATIGASSCVSCDAPDDKLTVARARQVTIEGWSKPKKTKTESD